MVVALGLWVLSMKTMGLKFEPRPKLYGIHAMELDPNYK